MTAGSPGGSFAFTVDLVDLAGNESTGLEAGQLEIDNGEPGVVEGSVSVSPDRAPDGTEVIARFR